MILIPFFLNIFDQNQREINKITSFWGINRLEINLWTSYQHPPFNVDEYS